MKRPVYQLYHLIRTTIQPLNISTLVGGMRIPHSMASPTTASPKFGNRTKDSTNTSNESSEKNVSHTALPLQNDRPPIQQEHHADYISTTSPLPRYPSMTSTPHFGRNAEKPCANLPLLRHHLKCPPSGHFLVCGTSTVRAFSHSVYSWTMRRSLLARGF